MDGLLCEGRASREDTVGGLRGQLKMANPQSCPEGQPAALAILACWHNRDYSGYVPFEPYHLA